MQLIDKEDDISLLLGQLIEHSLEALLELAAVFGTSYQRTHIQREHSLVFEPFGDLTIDDALGQPFGNGSFTHPGLTDKHRIVFGPTL